MLHYLYAAGGAETEGRRERRGRDAFNVLTTWADITLGMELLCKSKRRLMRRPLKKRCRILPAGGLGVAYQLYKSPKIGGLGG